MPSVATYAVILAGSALLVLNPLVVYALFRVRALTAFTVLLDLWLVAIVLFGIVHLRRRGQTSFWLMTASIVTLVPGLLLGEIAFTYLRHQYGDRLLGEVPAIFREDPQLIYSLIPGAVGQHASVGNFDVEYVIDEQGRKLVPSEPDAGRVVHVFGDSFTFGYGVANEDTWPNLLSARLGDEIAVLNYGVIGYSLEQMYLALERYADQVTPGDLVIFAPISADLERSLVGKLYVCGGMIRTEANEVFPKLEDGRWVYQPLADTCNLLLDSILANSPLPIGFGSLYRYLHHQATLPAMIANADAVFALAEQRVAEGEAEFMVVFLATPDECARGTPDVELTGLTTPHHSLLSSCPESPAAIRFPHDDHYDPDGHAWAADAVHRLLTEPRLPTAAGAD
jgi:hypothetical protein